MTIVQAAIPAVPGLVALEAAAAAFLLVDLGQFLTHWLSHRVNVLWACHAVHHSSGELNYAVGLRNSAFHGFFTWVFFLPLPAGGAVLRPGPAGARDRAHPGHRARPRAVGGEVARLAGVGMLVAGVLR